MTAYNKLVRDRIPEILDAKHISYEKRIANDAEYRAELIKKLVEEAHEFAEAGNIEELADVMEVVLALRTLPEYTEAEHVRKQKALKRGGFAERILLKGEKA